MTRSDAHRLHPSDARYRHLAVRPTPFVRMLRECPAVLSPDVLRRLKAAAECRQEIIREVSE